MRCPARTSILCNKSLNKLELSAIHAVRLSSAIVRCRDCPTSAMRVRCELITTQTSYALRLGCDASQAGQDT